MSFYQISPCNIQTPVKITTLIYPLALVGTARVKCGSIYPLTKARALKTQENSFRHFQLVNSYNLRGIQKNTINSALEFSISI